MAEDLPISNGDAATTLRRREVDSIGRVIPISDDERQAHLDRWNDTVRKMAAMVDESDTDELWDEVLLNLGVDPATGGGLEP